jgi:hypothetical protein
MSTSFTARLATGAGGFTSAPTFTTAMEPEPGRFFWANDATGAPRRWLVAWVVDKGSAGIECGCEGPLPPPPPPPSHP